MNDESYDEDNTDHWDEESEEETLDEEASYVCNSCGEEIVVPIDISQGRQQEYVEDCPVCCNPNLIYVEFDHHGVANVWSRPE